MPVLQKVHIGEQVLPNNPRKTSKTSLAEILKIINDAARIREKYEDLLGSTETTKDRQKLSIT